MFQGQEDEKQKWQRGNSWALKHEEESEGMGKAGGREGIPGRGKNLSKDLESALMDRVESSPFFIWAFKTCLNSSLLS